MILVCGYKLSLVIGASISDHNLRWVLVWHDHSWLGQSASETIGVISLKWFFQHASMKILSNFELISGQGNCLCRLFGTKVNWLWCSISEGHADCLSILLKNRLARGDLGVLEHHCWFHCLFGVNLVFKIKSILLFCNSLLFKSCLLSHCFFNSSSCHDCFFYV